MPEETPAVIQLIRGHHHLFCQCSEQGRPLVRWLGLSAGHPVPPPLDHLLLQQMNRLGNTHRCGVFYAGGTRNPHMFLLDCAPDVLSLVGYSCTPEQAEQRFQPCTLPDVTAAGEYTTAVLHRVSGIYRPDARHPLTAADRRLVRQCFLLDGPDFPEICFRWSGPVQWFRLHVQSGILRCLKFHLMPLSAVHRQVLLLWRDASPEEMMRSFCHIPDVSAPQLTPREQQAMALARQGLPNRAIAAMLQIQEGTVKKQLSAVYAKLGIHSRYDLLRLNSDT